MAHPRAERQVVIGVDGFGDLTAGDDGGLLSEPQNIRGLFDLADYDRLFEENSSSSPGCAPSSP